MKKVIVASENPVKVEIAKEAFGLVYPGEEFEFVAIKSDSGVPDQPMGEETRQGARNRLAFIQAKFPNADFWISQEGGLFEENGRLSNRAWITISDKAGFTAEASTSNFYLPKRVAEYVREGLELGHANDKFFNTVNSKQGSGAIGHLTDGVYNRVEYYLQPAVIALSEIKHKDWFI